MGLLNARNLRKAKALLDNNRHKVGGIVEKAGSTLDKASKGKTSNVTAKAADAAKKYSAGSATHHGLDTQPMSQEASGHPSEPDMHKSQAAAAGAVKGAADALTNLLNKTAAKVEATDPKTADADAAASDWPAPTGEAPTTPN